MNSLNKPETIIDALEDCLESFKDGELTDQGCLDRYHQHEKELIELLNLIQSLNSLGELSPRREFVDNATQHLISRLPDRKITLRERLPRIWHKPMRPVHRSLVFVKIGLAVLLIFPVFMIGGYYAADASGPGDPLYFLDLALEEVQLSLAPDAESVARLQLGHATERLQEAKEKLDDGEVVNVNIALNAYAEKIATIAQQIGDAEDTEREALVELLNAARSVHLDVLNELRTTVPEKAKPAIQQAIEAPNPYIGTPGSPPSEMPQDPQEDAEPQKMQGPPEGVPSGPPEDKGSPDRPGSPEDIPIGSPEDGGEADKPEVPEDIPTALPEVIGPPEGLPTVVPEDIKIEP
jgi:hypothetical protein